MIAVISDIHGNLGALEAVLQDLDRLDLAGLPFLWRLPHRAGDVVVVHATPWSIADVVPPDAPVTRVFTEAAAPAVVVYGHIHIAYVREAAGKVLVNPGSVGLPFDGDQRASYAVLDVDGGRWQANLRRVAYDVAQVLEASRRSTNPDRERFYRRLERASGG